MAAETLVLRSGIVITNTLPEHAPQLETLQELVFPTLSKDEVLRTEHYLSHLRYFPDGQFVALDGDRVIGGTSSMRCQFDFDHIQGHSFMKDIGYGTMSNHDPNGPWLYGADMSVLDTYRGKGVGRGFYRARQRLVQRLGMAGQLIIGMPNGYGDVSHLMSLDDYYAELLTGRRTDPTISMQQRMGGVIRGLIYDYLSDPQCGNGGIILTIDASIEI